MPVFTLALLSLALGYAVFENGGVLRVDWNISLVLIGASILLYRVIGRAGNPAPPLERYLRWPLLLLPAYVVLQLIPLPLAVLEILSPARADLAAAVATVLPSVGWAPLSVNPPRTFEHLQRICAYAATFLVVREIDWRVERRPWIVALPLVSIAAGEAILGMTERGADGFVRGTYVNRNHFAGLLEMALPFAAAYALSAMRRRSGKPLSVERALAACLGLSLAAMLLAAVLFSLSRMGFFATLVALGVVAVCEIPGRRRVPFAATLAMAIAVALIWLPPDALIERLTSLSAPGEISSDTRLAVWTDTLKLVRAYPVFGAGAGAFESAFYRYKTAAPLNTVDYAHNDYLQLLAELGVVGIAILAVAWFGLMRKLVRDVRAANGSARYLSVASLGALSAISVHSLADFNLYIPANALALAWVAGIAGVERKATSSPDRICSVLGVRPALETKASK